MSDTTTRRAALGALASLPALAIPAVAIAAPTSSARLADLIAAHDAAFDAIQAADAAVDELPYPPDVSVSFLGRELSARGEIGTHREKLTSDMELNFEVAMSMMMPKWWSPELCEAARGQTGSKACRLPRGDRRRP